VQIWKGSPNFWPKGMHDVCAIVIHTMVGSLASCDAQFSNPASQVSAHFGVGLDGTVHQYVDDHDGAWANGVLEPGNQWEPVFGSENPNRRTISIETEDRGRPDDEPVTDAQYRAVLSLCRQARLEWPGITHLVAHHAISPQSRSCPAGRWLASGRFDQLARELGLSVLR
jgi:N-acetyl-anhydromuramyl-L-alanine amidase AmpD